MQKFMMNDVKGGFNKLIATGRSQAATMVLDAGEATGGPDNVHKASDQWLYVLAGQGKAVVNGEEVSLQPGALLLIQADEAHEIGCTGDEALETFSIYAPPAY